MKETWILYDTSEEYVRRFRRYVRRHGHLPGSLFGCWERESFRKLCREAESAPFLLVSEEAWEELAPEERLEAEGLRAGICWLSEHPDGKENRLLRYQPMPKLLQEILRCFGTLGQEDRQRSAARLWGLCAPGGTEKLGACGWILARCFSESGRTLYVSFRSWGGMEEETSGSRRGLSDVLYRQRAKDSRLSLGELVERRGDLDVIPGPSSPLDLWEMQPGELKELLQELRDSGGYDCVVAEFGADLAPEVWAPLCDRILLLREETRDSRLAAESFRRYLKECGAEEATRRCREVILPPCPELRQEEGWDSSLRYSRLGQTMEACVEEEWQPEEESTPPGEGTFL